MVDGLGGVAEHGGVGCLLVVVGVLWEYLNKVGKYVLLAMLYTV